jgi:hypothetical protein
VSVREGRAVGAHPQPSLLGRGGRSWNGVKYLSCTGRRLETLEVQEELVIDDRSRGEFKGLHP